MASEVDQVHRDDKQDDKPRAYTREHLEVAKTLGCFIGLCIGIMVGTFGSIAEHIMRPAQVPGQDAISPVTTLVRPEVEAQ